MLKKITLISLAVMLVMLTVTAILIPMTISQVASEAKGIVAAYTQQEERLTIPGNEIQTVSMDYGNWITQVQLLPSEDDDIHLSSDRYTVMDSQFSYSLENDGAHLEVGRYIRNDWSGLSQLQPENLMVLLSKAFAGATPRVVLYLPEGVAFDLDSWMVGGVVHDSNEVATYRAGQTGEHNELAEGSLSPGAGENGEQPIAETPIEGQAPIAEEDDAAQELRQKAFDAADDQDDSLREAYDLYMEREMDETEFWRVAEPFINNMAGLYAQLAPSLEGYENRDGDPAARKEGIAQYMKLVAEKNLAGCRQELLREQYDSGEMGKAEFYSADLEMDAARESLEEQMNTAHMHTMAELCRGIEEYLGCRTVFVRELD